MRVIVEGVCRARLGEVVSTKPFIEAYADVFNEEFEGDRHLEAAYIRRLKNEYEKYFANNSRGNVERYTHIMATENLSAVVDEIIADIENKIANL